MIQINLDSLIIQALGAVVSAEKPAACHRHLGACLRRALEVMDECSDIEVTIIESGFEMNFARKKDCGCKKKRRK